MATFVLVHGSCHGGWYWKKVTPLLRKYYGHDMYFPTLTGLGERSHLVSKDIDLYTHVRDITQLLEYEDLTEVILVGHNYGGLVIGGVAERIPERIKRLVYLDGYILEDNKSAFNLIPGLEAIYKKRALTEHGKEWLVASYDPRVWGVINPTDIRWMETRLSSMPWHTHDQSLRIISIQA
jgi:pimeloyl-ACP methyl ester carboxylesterase